MVLTLTSDSIEIAVGVLFVMHKTSCRHELRLCISPLQVQLQKLELTSFESQVKNGCTHSNVCLQKDACEKTPASLYL